jgi:hypothetical protein
MDIETHLGVVLNISEDLNLNKEKSKGRHPLKLLIQGRTYLVRDTFLHGCLKGVDRIYQFTACCCFSKLLDWAKLYLDTNNRFLV